MKKLLLFFSIALAFSYTATSQEFRMGDGRFTTCSGNFVDSGGVSANYANSENSVITFCSPFPTDKVQVSFNSINLASGDLLFVYDGDAVAGAPLRVLTLGANGTTPVFLATAANTTGCLTFRFISDTSNNGAGWNATLACVDNCQTITSAVATTPAPDADGILRLCQGETVNFVGTGNFSVSGANATYKYVFDDGTEVTGTTATRTYTDPGIYKLDFVVTDDMNCRDRSLEDLTILVSTTPDFTGTGASATDICFGDQVTLTGAVTTTQFFANVAPPISGQTFLPDGSGVAYQTCIDVSGFPNGRTFQNASDLINVFINMEHSYMGDLDIKLTAPNGSQVSFLTFPNSGGGRFLGMALDDGTTTPGVGLDYFFTETATLTLDQSTPGVAFGGIMPSGNYRPEDPFANFIGTPLNGLWCLDIVDNLSIDNGYIFEWGINFNPAIIPTAGTFTPAEVTEAWVANADIISTTGTDIVVQPSQVGQNCYVFELTDDFGCTYSETVCVNVAAEITSIDPTDIVVCQNSGAATVDLTSRDAETLNGLDATTYTVGYYNSQADAAAQTGAIATPGAYAVTANETVFVRVSDSVSGCFEVQELDIIYSQAAYNQVPNLELCDDLSGDGLEIFDLSAQTAGILGSQDPNEFGVAYFTSQADADANSAAITTPGAFQNTTATQTIFVRVTNLTDSDCYTTGSFDVIVRELPQIGTGMDLTECDDSPIDQSATFDLSVNDAALLNGQVSTAFTVSYHDSASSAEAGTNTLNSTATALRDGDTIYARITDNATGCFNVSTFNIIVELCEVIIPEGFSPNNDGVNDTFSIPGLDQYSNFELMIFNR
ncbi:MAG: PKD domain-containing protein, partial [Nonlabens sp.]|nr:PKD domain-containing protein [Nonlabens sp.]